MFEQTSILSIKEAFFLANDITPDATIAKAETDFQQLLTGERPGELSDKVQLSST